MIAVALPDIVRSLGATIADATWLVTLYLIAMAALQPVGGKLGDTFGRRRLLLASLSWFGAASVCAALATDISWLTAFRLQQALGGALMIPNAGAVLRTAVPATGRGSAFALLAAATGVGAAAGPAAGGALVTQFGWHATFLVNLPIVGVALALGWRAIPRDSSRSPAPFDLGGALGLSLLLATAAWTLGRARTLEPALLAALVVSVALGGLAFVRYERRRADAVIGPELFRDRTFAAANAAIAFGNLALYATLLGIPALTVSPDRQAEAPLVSGLLLSVLFVAMVGLSPVGGWLADRSGRRWPAVAGYALFSTSSLILAAGASAAGPLILPLLLSGIGLGLTAGGLRAAAVETVTPEGAGVASGVFSASRYTGGILGALVVAAVLEGPPSAQPLIFVICAAAAAAAALVSLLLRDWPTVASH